MSSRFPPAHDSRYAPRTRSRSPPRYQEWRPSGPPNPAFPNRHGDFARGIDPPRGPKTFSDTPRGPAAGPGAGPSAPLGPRGRGGPPRTEFRELRDAPPLGTDRSFREREFDRRTRPPSPRMRSPVRSFRDGPPPVRELDVGRGRRDSRDGPIATGSSYSDTPTFGGPPTFSRGGFNGRGRGRGRGNFDFRDRRAPTDDRNTFRPRDRSPPTRWGSVSRPDRDDWRPERREDDRWHDREEREREPDRFRRDTASTRFDSRPPTPHQQAPSAPLPPERAPPFDTARDESGLRRPSAISLSANKEPPRRDALPPQPQPPIPLPPNDLLAGRVESSAARYGSRASSPPPSAPQVPAFGSLSFKSQAYTGPTSNVWKASPEYRAPNVPNAPPKQPVASSPVPKAVPTAPKAQLAAPPLAAPRAPRALEGGPPMMPRDSTLERAPSAPKARNSSAPQPPIPTAPWALRADERSGQFSQGPMREGRSLSGSFPPNAGNIPTSPRGSVLPPPLARPYDQVVPQDREQIPSSNEGGSRDPKPIRSDMAPPRLGTPPPSAPIGPRNAQPFNTSPVLPISNVPTAPKAIRGLPVAPRSADRGQPPHRPVDRPGIPPSRAPLNAPRAPPWNQWIRPGAQIYREPVIPAKRDAAGEERTQQPAPHASPTQNIVRQISDSSTNRNGEVRDDRMLKTAPASPERGGPDVSNVVKDERPQSFPDPILPTERQDPQPDGMSDTEMKSGESSAGLSDEEGMDLDEEDFAQSKAKFERQKAHLEAQMIDLSARQYRATTPLERISKLARITVHDLPGPEVPILPESEKVDTQEDQNVHPNVASPAPSTASRMQEDAEPKAVTPKQEQAEDVEELATTSMEDVQEPNDAQKSVSIRGDDDIVEDIVMEGSDALDAIMPQPKPRIETINLPYLVKAPLTPLSELGMFQETTARHIALKPILIDHFQAQAEEDNYSRQELHGQYVEKYRDWRLQTQLLDHERADKEPAERQLSAELGLDFDSSSVIAETSVSESRSRLHKYNSEYDFQKVLKESEETARLEQEKLERESRRAQIDLEKEAVIPDIWDESSREKRLFKNMNRYRDPICLTEIYGYEPAVDTFTDAEHKRFLELFKDRPKKWGEIAEQLPGRSYADCIHHYYKYKWDGRFKEGKHKRRGKGGRGRGGKAGVSRARAPLMADLSKNEEDGSRSPMLTETGRPRRAATRTVYTAETEAKASSSTTVPTKKGPPSGENSAEKPIKRRKTTATGEKVPKRSRQNLVTTAATSPAGNERDLVISKEDLARAQSLEDASLLAGLQAGHRTVSNPHPTEYAHEVFPVQHQVPTETAERSRTATQPPMQRSSASSYWSVPEQTDFVKFIAHFGTDFSGIANHMGTKTQTMVKNYYQRLVESGNRPDVVEAGEIANERRRNGEDMGVPPTPTPINKRRYDNPGPALPRTVSGSQGEVMDIDPVPSTQPATAQPSSSQFQHQYRFSMSNQPTPMQPQRAGPTPLQANVSPALGKSSLPAQPRQNPPSGPKMGFFSESRLDRRPPMQPQERAVQQQSPSLMQQNSTPPSLMHQNLSHLTSEFVKNLKEEQERALSIQKRASQEHVPQVTTHHPLYQPLAAQPPASAASPQPSMLDRAVEREERPGTPGLSNMANPRSGPAMFRSIMGSPAPLASPPVSMQPPFRSAHIPSPPKREEYRPGSVPAPSPAPSIAKPVMSLAATPAPEPRKTSNLASLLNSEPEEPRSKKRVGEQGLPAFTQSPTVTTLNAAPSGSSAPMFPSRRDLYNQTPIPRSDFDSRSTYPQPASHAPTPTTQHESLSGRAATPVGSRQGEWATRPPMTQGLTSSSPHPPTPLERDVRPYFSHRATNLGSLNSQSRHNPSPPPNAHPFLSHSRTPSLGGRPLTPTQMQPKGVTGLSHMGQAQTSQAQQQVHHVNAYGQTIVPASHMQQIQAHQQGQLHHRQNSSGSSSHSLHQRQPSRGEEMIRQQERDFHVKREYEQRMEMERQQISRQQKDREAHYQAQAQQQQQEQQRYAQHRASQSFQPQQLSGPPLGMSLREQARLEADQSFREEQFRRDRERFEHEREYIRRAQQDEEDRLRYDYRAPPGGMMGRGGFPPPPPQHRRQG